MKLILDLGNTKHKAAIYDKKEIVALYHYDELKVDDIHEIGRSYNLISAILSSVDHANPLLEEEILKEIPLTVLDHNTPLPINILYKTPRTLGKDRIAASVGAIDIFADMHILVIDAGSCVTFDFIDLDKNYLGGAISPGMTMRLQSMHTFTANLPLVNMAESEIDLLGMTTEDSMRSGAYWGMIKEIDGIIDAYRSAYSPLKVILTGGDAPFFESKLKSKIFAVPNLVLRGLNVILDFNATGKK